MRTTAETQISPAAEPGTTVAGTTVAGRRGRAAAKPAAAPVEAPSPAPQQPQPVAVATVRMLRVDEGLYALRVGEIAGNLGEIGGMAVPAAHVSAPFTDAPNGV